MAGGSDQQLTLLRQQLSRIASGEAMREMTIKLATEVQKQILTGTNEQRDPYGKSWAPRKKPSSVYALRYGAIDDGHPLLDKTGKLINSIRTKPIARGVRVTTVDYAVFHQAGTAKMPARKIVPDPVMGLGAIWMRAIEGVAEAVLRRLFGAV